MDQRRSFRRGNDRGHSGRRGHQSGGPATSVPAKRSAADADEDAWVADENRFVLQQTKQRAFIRAREGRARPIDWLAIVARVLFDKPGTRLSLDGDDDKEDESVEIVDPDGVFASLRADDLKKLKAELQTFCELETDPDGQRYWNTMLTICTHRLKSMSSRSGSAGESTGINVDAEVEKLLANKSESDLVKLESQVRTKLRSNDCVDVEYWQNLLSNLLVLKDKAHLKTISKAVIEKRLERLRKQQDDSVAAFVVKLSAILNQGRAQLLARQVSSKHMRGADPEPLLSLMTEDRQLRAVDEAVFLSQLTDERNGLRRFGYIPAKPQTADHEQKLQLQQQQQQQSTAGRKRPKVEPGHPSTSRFALPAETTAGSSSSALAQYEREIGQAATAGENDEEMLMAEDVVSVVPKWANQYKPRKPRYFNRVVMGYEWNKYNQTHFDHDNPPPKVPQGYKFNIFYPDLIDRTKAPTYKIEREKKNKQAVVDDIDGGDGAAGAGKPPSSMFDTCMIRFIAGPPYEDLCFRIVDREWDFSAKRERAFRSNFTERGLLELHFQFKKIYYRK